jgi:ABC-type multidrug transport system fused ATPase/permease subunit
MYRYIYIYIYRTGSGKSSILNALFRLYEKDEGYIFIKGIEQSNMSLKEMRQKMAIIP